MFFMAVDILGGVFSLLSLVFKEDFDVLAGVAYSLVVVSVSPRFVYPSHFHFIPNPHS